MMQFDERDCPTYLRDYLTYISTIKNRSELTLKNYYCDIRMFLRYLKISRGLAPKGSDYNELLVGDVSEEVIKSVTLNDIIGFLHFTRTERDNQAKSRSRKAVSIRQFFSYLTKNKGWFSVSPALNLELPTPKKSLPKHLTVDEATTLLDDNSEIKCWQDARDYCILTFFLNCGMRLSELVSINVTDYIETKDADYNQYAYLKVLGKGSKERIIYLNSACVDAYKTYIEYRPKIAGEKALFLSRKHGRISNRRVQQIIEERLKISGLSGKGISVHKLRHTAATLMYQNGVDVRVLKDILGHENLGTTQIYTHVSDNQMKNAMDKNPLASKKKK